MATPSPVSDFGSGGSPNLPSPKRHRQRDFQLFVVFVALLAAMIAAADHLPQSWSWIGTAGALSLLVLLMGQWSCRRWLGILIDYRNLMSLARFQAVIWIIIVLSAFVAMVALRHRLDPAAHNAMAIAFPPELWTLMGISTASLVGAPMLLQSKQDRSPSANALEKAASVLNQNSTAIRTNSYGTLYSNPSLRDAAITDMLQGDEIANTAYLDLAKVQMFLFTVIGALIYAYALYNTIAGAHEAAALATFPALPQGMITLLGISHAGYLTSKTADRTPSANGQ